MKEYRAQYKIREIYPDTYAIADGGIGQGAVQMYLLVGQEKAMLIDSGYGLLDLKKIVGEITGKEVICVCTHGHVDHALGACQFEKAFLHSEDFDIYLQHTSREMLETIAYKGMMKLPKRMLKNPNYLRLAKQLMDKEYLPLHALDDIKQFDLGGRIISWRLIPGHTPGCTAFFDEKNHVIFDGDGAPVGAFLFLPESSALEDYAAALEDYVSYLKQNGVEKRYVGHSGTPLKIKSVENLIRCSRIAAADPSKGIKASSSLGKPRIVFAGGTLMFCGRE